MANYFVEVCKKILIKLLCQKKEVNLFEELTYNTKGELQVKYTYEHDKNENEIECIHHDNFCFSKITYKCNEQGNLIREKSYCPDGSLCEEKVFEYEFDQNENWIKKIERLIDDRIIESKTIYDRTIKYY